MKMSDAINNTRKEYPSQGMSGVDKYFNFKVGKNIFRIISDYAIIGNHWIAKVPSTCYGMNRGCKKCVEVEKAIILLKEKKDNEDMEDKDYKEEFRKIPTVNIQYVCYVIDRADSEIKLAKLPYSVAKKMKSWEERSEEYPHSDKGIPIFDIEVEKIDNKGRIEYDTNVVISSLKKELTDEEKAKMKDLNLEPNNYVVGMKKKQMTEDGLDSSKVSFDKDSSGGKEENLPTINIEEEEIDVNDIDF